MKQEGIVNDGLEIAILPPGYRGIKALRDFEAGEEVIIAPYEVLLSSDVAKERPMVQLMLERVDEMPQDSLSVGHNALLLYLLEFMVDRRTEHHYYRPFFDILPQELSYFESMPGVWSDEEAWELLGETSESHYIRGLQLESYEADYNALLNIIPNFERFTFEQYYWAGLLVATRSFADFRGVSDGQGLFKAPFIDMLNHVYPENKMHWIFDDKDKRFVFIANERIEKDSEVTINYEAHTNAAFLNLYGFTTEDNWKLGSVWLRMEITSERDPWHNVYDLRDCLASGFFLHHHFRRI